LAKKGSNKEVRTGLGDKPFSMLCSMSRNFIGYPIHGFILASRFQFRNCGLAQNGLSYAPDTLSA
jgi:hypothetical protein